MREAIWRRVMTSSFPSTCILDARRGNVVFARYKRKKLKFGRYSQTFGGISFGAMAGSWKNMKDTMLFQLLCVRIEINQL